jgi:ABC-type transport system involved in cytochrome bd biosynthesis fused ATPase/permease subunit
MEDIIVTSKADFKSYFNISLRVFYGGRGLFMMLIVAAVMQGMSLLGGPITWADEVYLLGVFVFLYGMLVPALAYFTCKANMKRSASLREQLRYTINEDKIAYEGETMSTTSNWQYVTKLIEREKYFTIFVSSRNFYFLSKQGFQSKEDMNRLKAIAKEKGIKFSYK